MAGRPKKYVRPIIRRKFMHCGKMKLDPYIKTIVPTMNEWDIAEQKAANKGKKVEKINRADLKGDRKCDIKYYCDQVCYSEATGVTSG